MILKVLDHIFLLILNYLKDKNGQRRNNIKTKTELRREKILNGNLWKVIFSLTLPLFIFAIFNYVGDLFEMIIANKLEQANLQVLS